jgi:DNA polymerase-3 subunit alpha
MVGLTMEEVYRLPLNDPAVLQGFRDGHVGGVFQFEGATTRDICVEVAPRLFMDLAHVTSLSRPGPLHGGSTADFIRSRNGESVRDRYPEVVERVLEATEGEVVYQEQVIMLAKAVGQFDAESASKIRAIISKKKGQAAFAQFFDQFAAGAAAQGVDAEVAGAVWKKMVTSGAYSFNAAHAVSYSVLSVWCMWFRVHHPLAYFYARLMANVDAAKDAKTKIHPTETILKDMAASTDIKVLPLDPVMSATDWTVEDGALRPGFRQVPGVGVTQGDNIVEWRRRLFDVEWADLLAVSMVGQGTVDKLKAFAEHPDPFGVGKIGRNVKSIVDWIPTSGEDCPTPDKLSSDIPYSAGRWDGVLLGVVQEIQFRDLFESHKNRTGEDLDPAKVSDPHLRKSATIYLEDTRGRFKVNVGRKTFPRYREDLQRIRVQHDYLLVQVGKSTNFPGKTLFANNLWPITPDED